MALTFVKYLENNKCRSSIETFSSDSFGGGQLNFAAHNTYQYLASCKTIIKL